MSRVDQVSLAGQASFGTPNDTPQYVIPVTSANAAPNREILEIDETIGNRFPSDIAYGTQSWEVSLEGAVHPDSFGRLLTAFLGLPTTDDTLTDANANSHIYDPVSASSLVPHTVRMSRNDPSTDIVDSVADVYGNELEISVEPNNYVMYAASLLGTENDDAQDAPSLDADTTPKLTWSDATVSFDDGGGYDEIKVAGWAMKYSNNLSDDDFVLGASGLYAIDPGNADCEITFIAREGLSDHYARALAEDPDAFKIKLSAVGQAVQSADFYTLTIEVHRIQYLEAPAEVSGSDVLRTVEVTARAAYNVSDDKFVTVTLINAENSYA